MNILIAADLHHINNTVLYQGLCYCYNVDAIITLGDNFKSSLSVIQNYFKGIPFVGVHGNHDVRETLECVNIANAHLKRQDIDNITILGIEGCSKHPDKAYIGCTQNESVQKLFRQPKCDIFIGHTSPYGINDEEGSKAHTGFLGILTYIKKHQPKYCLHGHMHENKQTKVGNTTVIGVYGLAILNYETGLITRIQLDM